MTPAVPAPISVRRHSRNASALIPALLLAITGCGPLIPVLHNTDVPGEIQQVREPVHGGEYYVYVPSTYDSAREWPVVISCHGTPPWDNAKGQIQEWVDLAESKQFIAIAPILTGTRGDFVPPAAEQIRRQEEDEKVILAVLDHVRAGKNIAEDKVFLTGWSAGGYAVLYTGLKHPEIFRALAVRQGNFDSRFVAPTLPFADPHQPVYVMYGAVDFLKEDAEKCLEWLRENRLLAVEEEIVGSHKRHPELAYEFFRRSLRQYAWIHPAAYRASGDDPLLIQFRAKCSPQPTAYLWRFGDGEYSREAVATHRYAQPGRYEVKLTTRTKDAQYVRSMEIDVRADGIATARTASFPDDPAGDAK